MKEIYRYQLRIYALYLAYKNEPFYTKSGMEACNRLPFRTSPISYMNLSDRGLIEVIKDKEYSEKNLPTRRTYRRLSASGLELARKLEKEVDKKFITKLMLRM